MLERELATFIDGTTHYFAHAAQRPAIVGTPYLIEPRATLTKDFTGVIGVSGKRRGIVYFTASAGLLRGLLDALGDNAATDENLRDLVGEVANTISGNARRDFGSQFMISVPRVIAGAHESLVRPEKTRSFVIPIQWLDFEAELVVCLQ